MDVQQVIDIIDRNFATFMRSNEATLQAAEDIVEMHNIENNMMAKAEAMDAIGEAISFLEKRLGKVNKHVVDLRHFSSKYRNAFTESQEAYDSMKTNDREMLLKFCDWCGKNTPTQSALRPHQLVDTFLKKR